MLLIVFLLLNFKIDNFQSTLFRHTPPPSAFMDKSKLNWFLTTFYIFKIITNTLSLVRYCITHDFIAQSLTPIYLQHSSHSIWLNL